MAARIILNPVAGNGKALKVFDTLKPYLNEHDVEVVRTKEPGDATVLAREVAHLEDMTVISLGGDGTHHEVINGLMPGGAATFAVIPAGTGNDFVRMLHYPTDPTEMLTLALHGPTQWIDIGQVNDEYFLTVSGVGFDAEVAGWVNARSKAGNGTRVFLRGVVVNLLRYRAQPLTVELKEARRSERTFLLACGISQYYAGGMKICPGAEIDDGLFDVVWVNDIRRIQVLPLLARVFRGTHVKHPAVRTFQTPELTVTGPESLWVHADGEVIGHLPVTLRVVAHAIRVRMGASA